MKIASLSDAQIKRLPENFKELKVLSEDEIYYVIIDEHAQTSEQIDRGWALLVHMPHAISLRQCSHPFLLPSNHALSDAP
jgi:hypothetical protein